MNLQGAFISLISYICSKQVGFSFSLPVQVLAVEETGGWQGPCLARKPFFSRPPSIIYSFGPKTSKISTFLQVPSPTFGCVR